MIVLIAAAAVACAQDPVALRLVKAARHPEVRGKSLSIALLDEWTGNPKRIEKAYCLEGAPPTPIAHADGGQPGCDQARYQIDSTGRVQVNAAGDDGTFCLSPAAGPLGLPIVRARTTLQARGQGICGSVTADVAYALPRNERAPDPIVLFSVFADRSETSLKQIREEALRRVTAMANDAVAAALGTCANEAERKEATKSYELEAGPKSENPVKPENRQVDRAIGTLGAAYQEGRDQPAPWLSINLQLPAVGASPIEAASGTGRDSIDRAGEEGQRLVLFAHDMQRDSLDGGVVESTGDRAAFVRGEAVTSQASDLARAGALVIALAAKAANVNLPSENEVSPPDTQRELNAILEPGEAPALELTSVDTLSARVFSSGKLEADFNYSLRICHGVTACDAKTTDENISAERSLVARSKRPLLALAAELAYSPLAGKNSPPLGGYQWQPIGGAGGPDQLYQLGPVEQFTSAVTISGLGVYYPGRGMVGIALGPSFFTGDSRSLFSQWNLRAVWSPVQKLLLTAGPSVRFVGVPRNYAAGTVISVPRDKPAPDIVRDDKPAWLFTVGIGADLSLVTDALGDAAKLFNKKDASSAKQDTSHGQTATPDKPAGTPDNTAGAQGKAAASPDKKPVQGTAGGTEPKP